MRKVELLLNGEVVLPFSENTISCCTGTSVYLERPRYMELHVTDVTLPTFVDPEDIVGDKVHDCYFKEGDEIFFKAKCKLAIQGHGSAQYSKKGYTIDFLNEDENSLKIKFGDMISVDSYHFKAYATDMTHTRGLGGAAMWRYFVSNLPYPYCMVNNKPYNITSGQNADNIHDSDAKYSEDGFQVGFYINGNFFGLHTLKLKKTAANYALDKNNKNHIFLDSISYNAFFSEPFSASDWEMKTPKLTSYTEGGAITDADVLSNINRLFNFTKDITSTYANHRDYIVLEHWLMWYIFCEIVAHRDTNGNNYEVVTWDGTHWSLLPYDLDLTLGLNPAWEGHHTVDEARNQFEVATGNNYNPSSNDVIFWNNFRTVFANDLKTLYTDFRKRGIIEVPKLMKFYTEEAECIPSKIYEADRTKWGNIWEYNKEPNMQHIYKTLNSRIEFLDSQWLVNG